jgi:hypothetical protein
MIEPGPFLRAEQKTWADSSPYPPAAESTPFIAATARARDDVVNGADHIFVTILLNPNLLDAKAQI